MFSFIIKYLVASLKKINSFNLLLASNKIIIPLFCLSSLSFFNQLLAKRYYPSNLDNLKKAAETILLDNFKVDFYNEISTIYLDINIDSSLFYAEKALEIAEKIKYNYGIATAHSKISTNYFYLSNYYNSQKHGIKSIEYFRKSGSQKGERRVLSNMSATYISMGLFEKALEYNSKSLKIAKKIKDTLGLAYSYYVNSLIYSEFNMFKKAIDYSLKAIELYDKLNKLNQAPATSLIDNLAGYYRKINKPDSVNYYRNKALKIAIEKNSYFDIAYIYNNIGFNFENQGLYDSAIIYYYKSIDNFNKFKTNDVSKSYLNLSSLYSQINKMDSVKYYLDKANNIIIYTENFEKKCELNILYSNYYKKIKNFKKALDYYLLYTDLKDSILSEKAHNKLISYQIDYETEKLRTENEIQTLKINQSKNQRNFLILLFVLILTLAIVIYSRFVLKKKTNKLLTEKNIELENVNKIKDRFFVIVAHDLKNQLIAFQNISNVLKENYNEISDDKKHEFIIKIDEAANSLYEVLENLLTWSSSQIKGIEFEPKLINLSELVNKVFSELKLSAEKKEVFLKNEISPDALVWADENMVRNIIRNLINNSIKFSDEKSEVLIISVKKDNMVEVSIIDQGIGISDDDKEKLFKLDADFKKIGSHKNKGTGLGLIISKAFIEKMKGNIWINNNFERGCIFSFSLPINYELEVKDRRLKSENQCWKNLLMLL